MNEVWLAMDNDGSLWVFEYMPTWTDSSRWVAMEGMGGRKMEVNIINFFGLIRRGQRKRLVIESGAS